MSQTESAAAWSAVAAGWERHEAVVSANSRPVTERLLERLDPKPGERILEIGAGVGEVGLLVADRVGPDGHVTITDQAKAMVEAVRRRSEDRPNVTAAVVDAQSLDLPTGSVDGIVSRFAYMLVPDLDAAFDGSRRVLRSGGRLVFAVWASAPENPWASTVGRALVELGHAEPPDPDAPGPFRLHDQGRLRTLVTDAGFAEVGIEDVPLAMRYESFDDYWHVTRDLAMSLQEALGRLSADEADKLRSRVEQAFERYATADGLALPALARVVSATAR